MKRRLVNLLSVLSLAICLAACVVWVWSYWVVDEIAVAHAAYPKITDSDFFAKIMNASVRMNRGSIGIAVENSVDDLTLGTQNLRDWSEIYPVGWHFRHGREEAYKSEPSLPYDTLAPRTYLDRFGFFVGTCGIPGLFAEAANFIHHEAALPAWFLVACAAVLPAFRVRAVLRNRRRARMGLCVACGYDLRATPDRRPECGTVSQKAST